jgi:putative endonuclease
MPSRQQLRGLWAQQRAKDHLVSQGLRFIAENVGYRCGELDLIMADGDGLVFVEVRWRLSSRFGGALASVTRSKRQRLIRAAQCYLAATHLGRDRMAGLVAARFDVVGVEPEGLVWVPNAFGLDHDALGIRSL